MGAGTTLSVLKTGDGTAWMETQSGNDVDTPSDFECNHTKNWTTPFAVSPSSDRRRQIHSGTTHERESGPSILRYKMPVLECESASYADALFAEFKGV